MLNEIKKNKKGVTFYFLLLITIFNFSSCNKEAEIESKKAPEVYNPTSCIYGSMTDYYNNIWETIIDLETGKFTKISGMTRDREPLALPLGVRKLTDFTGNKSIFLSEQGKVLVAQDLETFEKTTINLNEQHSINRLMHLNFGDNNNEIYGLDYRTIYLINIINQTVEIIGDIPFDIGDINDFIYLKKQSNFVIFSHKSSDNTPLDNLISVYDPVTLEMTQQQAISSFFGFIKDPNSDNLFCLSTPKENKGFRLTKIQITDAWISIQQQSSTDLDIDKLSYYIQTIHTATNSYICKGGSTSFDTPQTYLYSIDLHTGELTNETFLEECEAMLDIKGE